MTKPTSYIKTLIHQLEHKIIHGMKTKYYTYLMNIIGCLHNTICHLIYWAFEIVVLYGWGSVSLGGGWHIYTYMIYMEVERYILLILIVVFDMCSIPSNENVLISFGI